MIRTVLLSLSTVVFTLPIVSEADARTLSITQTPSTLEQSIPQGAQGIAMLHLSLAAGCDGDVSLRSIRIRHEGLGNASDLSRIYAVSNGRRITRSASFTANPPTALLRFRSLNIPACSALELSILIDIAPDALAGSEHRLSIENADAIDAGSNTIIQISDSFLSKPEAAQLAPARLGVITAEVLQPDTIRYGRNRLVARLRLSADAKADQSIHAVTLINDGKARGGDLQNVSIETVAGKVLTHTLRQMDDDRIRFVFDPPVLLRKNATRLLNIRADVLSSRRKTIHFIIEEPSDLEAEPARARGRAGETQ